MTTTTYNIGPHIVRIHDPAETLEAKARRQKRLEQACVRFWKEKEKSEVRAGGRTANVC
jgi:hypothetical protein